MNAQLQKLRWGTVNIVNTHRDISKKCYCRLWRRADSAEAVDNFGATGMASGRNARVHDTEIYLAVAYFLYNLMVSWGDPQQRDIRLRLTHRKPLVVRGAYRCLTSFSKLIGLIERSRLLSVEDLWICSSASKLTQYQTISRQNKSESKSFRNGIGNGTRLFYLACFCFTQECVNSAKPQSVYVVGSWAWIIPREKNEILWASWLETGMESSSPLFDPVVIGKPSPFVVLSGWSRLPLYIATWLTRSQEIACYPAASRAMSLNLMRTGIEKSPVESYHGHEGSKMQKHFSMIGVATHYKEWRRRACAEQRQSWKDRRCLACWLQSPK